MKNNMKKQIVRCGNGWCTKSQSNLIHYLEWLGAPYYKGKDVKEASVFIEAFIGYQDEYLSEASAYDSAYGIDQQ